MLKRVSYHIYRHIPKHNSAIIISAILRNVLSKDDFISCYISTRKLALIAQSFRTYYSYFLLTIQVERFDEIQTKEIC